MESGSSQAGRVIGRMPPREFASRAASHAESDAAKTWARMPGNAFSRVGISNPWKPPEASARLFPASESGARRESSVR